jgi:non-specific serine/threonine protein kinase
MSKPYSNKALPPGTVLREWRLEEVLGVGGFGIVYKGRGIYFDELVAIKEYFPSSISERDAEDTVVPIDSDAEEVHALGLKKFVEEAKLLWNLSTPTRHPNIVSVRSLFEIHGTAYMVMDFEDGLSLSRMLKQGTRFNERSLWNMVRPIAEGLDRAHRVGVLHRDIKPPNILITEDNRPVLIDFGSARFEAAEATSTKVTFHTPPYAAIEQYVKTYPQGPWTDIYALGVVLYECVTGEKPPEVLERLHAGLGKPLATGKWAGYSRPFLTAIDAAMTIRPQERPQSITEWLAMFESADRKSARHVEEVDEDATRFFAHEVQADEIMPVAPPIDGEDERPVVDAKIPTDPDDVEFKGAGHETKPGKKSASASAAKAAAAAAAVSVAGGESAKTAEIPVAKDERKKAEEKPAVAEKPVRAKTFADTEAPSKKKLNPMIAGGAALAVLAAGAVGWSMLGTSGTSGADSPVSIDSDAVAPALEDVSGVDGLVSAANSLVEEARNAQAPAAAIDRLAGASEELQKRFAALQPLLENDAQAAAAATQAGEMKRLAMTASTDFANALVSDAEGRARRLSSAVPWANPAQPNAAGRETPERQAVAADVRSTLEQLRAAAQSAASAGDPAGAMNAAREALKQSQAFGSASIAAANLRTGTTKVAEGPAAARPVKPAEAAAAPATTATRAATTTAAPTVSADAEATSAQISQIQSIVSDGRGMAKDVIRMADRRPGSGATDAEKQAYQVRKANADLARGYDKYLASIRDSARGVRTGRDAERLIKQASQTRAYLTFLVRRSRESR